MPAPRASAGRLDILALLQQAMTGMFAPQREDGLKALSVNNRVNPAMWGTNPEAPAGLWGQGLVDWWNSQDPNTPDKMNFGRAREIAGMNPGSPFASWMKSSGGMRGGLLGAASYNQAMGQPGGGTAGGLVRGMSGVPPWYQGKLF
jgi:hypothetical protein